MPADMRMQEAVDIASHYDWSPEIPDAVEQIKRGVVPDGFGRLVGQTIVLFLARPVVGYGYSGMTRQEVEQYEQECRNQARRLARLRILIAEINTANRRKE